MKIDAADPLDGAQAKAKARPPLPDFEFQFDDLHRIGHLLVWESLDISWGSFSCWDACVGWMEPDTAKDDLIWDRLGAVHELIGDYEFKEMVRRACLSFRAEWHADSDPRKSSEKEIDSASVEQALWQIFMHGGEKHRSAAIAVMEDFRMYGESAEGRNALEQIQAAVQKRRTDAPPQEIAARIAKLRQGSPSSRSKPGDKRSSAIPSGREARRGREESTK